VRKMVAEIFRDYLLARTGELMTQNDFFEIGREYALKVKHRGNFNGKVTAIRDGWIECVITKGKTWASSVYKARRVGDSVSFKIDQISSATLVEGL